MSNKPFSMLHQEFIQGLTQLINNSGLPPAVVIDILVNAKSELSIIADKILAQETEKYNSELTAAEDSDDEDTGLHDTGIEQIS